VQSRDHEKLIEEAQAYAEDLEEMNNQLTEARFEAEQYKQYKVFEGMY